MSSPQGSKRILENTYIANFCRLDVDCCCTRLQLVRDQKVRHDFSEGELMHLRQLQAMTVLGTSTPQQRNTVSHQGFELDNMFVNVAFPLTHRKLVDEGHFHRELEKSIGSKNIRGNVIEIFWIELHLDVAVIN